MSRLKLTYIEWEDSASTQRWDEPRKHKPFVIRSAGILVRNDKDSVTLSTSRSPAGHYLDQITIPRSAIRKMRKIKG